MIHLNFEYLDEPIDIECFTSFVIADTKLYTKVIENLYRYEEESYLKLYADDYDNLKKTELMVITDIMGFDLNAASVLKLIYHDLEQQISEKPEKKSEIEYLLMQVAEKVSEELLDFDIDLEMDEITFLEVLKALGVQIEIKSDTIFERMFEILQLFRYLSRKKLLVLINCSAYFLPAEIEAINEYVNLQNIPFLMLDKERISGIKECYYLDTDYCLIPEKVV